MGRLCYNATHRRPSTDKLLHSENSLKSIHKDDGKDDGQNSSIDLAAGNLAAGDLIALEALRRCASDLSTRVYLVGGPVRDLLMGRPVKDLDFSVEGDAPALARRLSSELGGQVVVHSRFGTATVTADGARVDLVTARSETYAHSGALPQVTPGNIQDDLARRDFSINSLALPLASDSPQVVDYGDGLNDLKMGVVRTLHDGSFTDDPTRVFRAIRYEQRLGFRIEGRTLEQLKDAVNDGPVAALSPDRLRHEVERIFQEENPALALRRCWDLGVLRAAHPAFDDLALDGLDRLDRLTDRIGENGTTTDGEKSLAYLAVLVFGLPEQEGEELIGRLNMPETWRRVVRDSITLNGITGELRGDAPSPSRLVHLLENISIEAVTAVWLTSENTAAATALGRYLNQLRHVKPGFNGQDLLDLGVPPGPLVGSILGRLRDDELDGRAVTGAERMRLVEELMAEAGGDARHE